MEGKVEIDVASLDPTITVEQFLRKKCDDEIAKLKEQADVLIQKFKEESAEVRKSLVQELGP